MHRQLIVIYAFQSSIKPTLSIRCPARTLQGHLVCHFFLDHRAGIGPVAIALAMPLYTAALRDRPAGVEGRLKDLSKIDRIGATSHGWNGWRQRFICEW
jgi:hypothetical protein